MNGIPLAVPSFNSGAPPSLAIPTIQNILGSLWRPAVSGRARQAQCCDAGIFFDLRKR